MSEPAVTSDNNPILRLQLIARECPHRELGDWLWPACRRVLVEGITIDAALGLNQPGWQHPRQLVRQDRPDDLLRRLYNAHYRGTSLAAAAEAMVTDHLRLLARWGRMRPHLDLISAEPTTPLGFHELLAAEGHRIPGRVQLKTILRRAIVRPVNDLSPVETNREADAASEDVA